MNSSPLISICIPAYKRVDFLQRLLESIRVQEFRDFEVVVTDDSPDSEVKDLCSRFDQQFPLRYFRNEIVLGTPENWNEAVRKSAGEWIKLMHDDDFFSTAASLGTFAEATRKYPTAFIFSAYQNVYENEKPKPVKCSGFRLRELRKDPVSLLSKNCIGPPSAVIHRRNPDISYDKEMQWLVDIDYYIRVLKISIPVYLDQSLVSIGISSEQVTRVSSLVREVEIPEHFRILEKTGIHTLNNILVYDAWWRIFRNLNIKQLREIREAGYTGAIPQRIKMMIAFQRKLPEKLLHFGPFSKTAMWLSFTINR